MSERPDPGNRRIRVYVAGAADAPITHASLVALARHPGVDLVGLDLDRIDPARLRAADPDLLLSAAHQHLIRSPELGVARIGSVGLHPALLPRYRGSHPLWWALHNGEHEAGLTLYELDPGIDTGPILAQATVPIVAGDTFATLYARTCEEVAPLLDGLVEAVLRDGGLPAGRIQDESQATLFRAPTDRELRGPLRQRIARRLHRSGRTTLAALVGYVSSFGNGGGERS